MANNDNHKEVNEKIKKKRSPSPAFGIGKGLIGPTDAKSSGRTLVEQFAIKAANQVTESWSSLRGEGILKRRRDETDLDEKSEIDLIEDKGKRVRLSAKDTRDAIEQPGHSSSSIGRSEQGWQGTSAQTFEALLRKAVQELNVNQYHDTEELNEEIYKLYGKDREQLDSNEEEEKQYRKFLSGFSKALRDNEELKEIEYERKKGYRHFRHVIKEQPNESKGRYSLNIHPDRIPDVIPTMIQEIATLPYVYRVKVASKKDRANKRKDNVVAYFHKSNKNKHELEKILRSFEKDTRPDHPAMMEPIEGIEGIAFADEGNAVIEGGGWGRTRTRHIAAAMWDLRGEEITFEKLLPKVKERFRENNIDPNNPYRDLPEEQRT